MTVAAGFDNAQYVALQSERIRERIAQSGGRLYLEFGGKLFDDFHASRVLPGFQPDSKVKMLLTLRDDAEIVIAINAEDIEKSKRRGDLGILYDQDVLRLIDAFREIGLFVGSVVITRHREQPAALQFEKRLQSLGVRVHRHFTIAGYPTDLGHIVSEEGFGRNEYVQTARPLVIITAPGPGSGKMAVALSQLYHEHRRGQKAGYAKFETFPIWNLPLRHPVNLAYEAATADLNDTNMIDPFHLEAYRETAINYNRDIEAFPVLCAMLERILGASPYKSPTDMGVNMAGLCIIDDAVCQAAARQEILRRHYNTRCAVRQGLGDPQEVDRIERIMSQIGLTARERPVVQAAKTRAEQTGAPAVAMQMPDGRILTGKTSDLLGASAALLLNALKDLGGIQDDIALISPIVIEPIQTLKVRHMGNRNPRLHTDEILIALSICAATNPTAELALRQLGRLSGLEAHSTVILSRVDESVFQKLGVNLTCEPAYQTSKLYHR